MKAWIVGVGLLLLAVNVNAADYCGGAGGWVFFRHQCAI
jgi:hypothetical protein